MHLHAFIHCHDCIHKPFFHCCLIAHIATSQGTLKNIKSTKVWYSFLTLFPCFFYVCITTKIVSVVPFPNLNANCISSATTFSVILASNTRNVLSLSLHLPSTLLFCNSHVPLPPFPTHTDNRAQLLPVARNLPFNNYQTTVSQSNILYQDFHLSSFLWFYG